MGVAVAFDQGASVWDGADHVGFAEAEVSAVFDRMVFWAACLEQELAHCSREGLQAMDCAVVHERIEVPRRAGAEMESRCPH